MFRNAVVDELIDIFILDFSVSKTQLYFDIIEDVC